MSSWKRATLGALAWLLVFSSLAIPQGLAQQQQGAVSRITSEASQEIYSPFCPGKTLAMCPSSAAAEVRREIQAMAEEGKSKQEIKDAIITQYGEEFRQVEPPLVDEVTLLVLLGLGLLVALLAIAYLSRRRRRDDGAPVAGADGEAADSARPDPGATDGTLRPEDDEYLDTLRDEYLG